MSLVQQSDSSGWQGSPRLEPEPVSEPVPDFIQLNLPQMLINLLSSQPIPISRQNRAIRMLHPNLINRQIDLTRSADRKILTKRMSHHPLHLRRGISSLRSVKR